MFSRRSGSSSLTATGCAAAQGQGAPDLKAAGLQVPPVLSQTVPTGLRERSLTPRARDERGEAAFRAGMAEGESTLMREQLHENC